MLLLFCSAAYSRMPVRLATAPEDTEYLRGVMKDSFKAIYHYRNQSTGLCSDFPDGNNPNECMITEDIFLSMASVAIAGKIGLIPEAEAARETGKTLSSIEKLKRNWGFFRKVYSPSTLREGNDPYNMSDYGWNPSALAVVGEAYPQFRKRTQKLIDEMQWEILYDRNLNTLRSLLSFRDENTPHADWPINELSNDSRTTVFMAIASGKVPPSVWDHMKNEEFRRYGVMYYGPAERLGYGEQPWALSYFLDERCSRYGMSNANLVWAQMCYARDLEFPTWGWSSCQGMHGYMGWGNRDTNWSRVNTHAIAAAAMMYPIQAAKAFRKLEELGLRKYEFGFGDSIDMDTGAVPGYLVTGLDENIVFLCLANCLYDGVVWKYYEQNKTVKNGISLIADYREPHEEYLDVYAERDRKGPSLPPKGSPGELVLDDFTGDRNNLGSESKEYNCALTLEDSGYGRVDYNFLNDQLSCFIEPFKADLTDYNAVKLVMRGEGEVMVNFMLGGEGGYRRVALEPDWKEVILPFRAFLNGKYSIESNGNKGWTAFYYNRKSGGELSVGPVTAQRAEIKKISFARLPKEKIRLAAAELNAPGY